MKIQTVHLTDWFSEDVNPVHVGVYQIDRGSQGKWYRFWNGEFWALCGETIQTAYAAKVIKSPAPAFPWRGIYKEVA